MSTPAIVVLGERLKPLERIARVGEVLGLPRATAPPAERRLAADGRRLEPLRRRDRALDELGIPYTVEARR